MNGPNGLDLLALAVIALLAYCAGRDKGRQDERTRNASRAQAQARRAARL